ncbi:MAG: hypothetical protein IMF19_03440 [Proteobacteria bacterium]|nr:hypothetical protein [Pseudomonadota bacterium]
MKSCSILLNLKNRKTYLKDLGYSLGPFIKELPKLRKEYRKSRSDPQIPIADEKQMGIPEDFIHVLESAKSSDELVDALQSILGVEEDMGVVCLC